MGAQHNSRDDPTIDRDRARIEELLTFASKPVGDSEARLLSVMHAAHIFAYRIDEALGQLDSSHLAREMNRVYLLETPWEQVTFPVITKVEGNNYAGFTFDIKSPFRLVVPTTEEIYRYASPTRGLPSAGRIHRTTQLNKTYAVLAQIPEVNRP